MFDVKCDGILLDVTANCNLRCPYCVNDWSQIKGNHLMKEDVFDRAISLAVLLKENCEFLISCVFEPTMHPRFLQLLDRIPVSVRPKVAFTTNLATIFKDSYFEKLSRSGLKYINISLDSMQDSVFEELRKNSNFRRFKDNFDRMVKIFSENPESPQIRVISLVCKSNLEEIPELVGRLAEEYRVAKHVIRPFWLNDEIAERAWIKEEELTLDEFLELRSKLGDFSGNLEFGYNHSFNPEFYCRFPGWRPNALEAFLIQSKDENLIRAYSSPFETAQLLISSNGSVRIASEDPRITFNLKQVQSPVEFFSNLIALQKQNTFRGHLLKELADIYSDQKLTTEYSEYLRNGKIQLNQDPSVKAGSFDNLVLDPDLARIFGNPGFRASGWARDPREDKPAEKILLVAESQEDPFLVAVGEPRMERFDVWEIFQKSHLFYTGWKLSFDQKQLFRSPRFDYKLHAYCLKGSTAFKLDKSWVVGPDSISSK